jgi:hypothetical protein
VAVGAVNWYLKRWSAKGLVKVKKIGRWRWRYLLTPKAVAEKADLANRYFEASMRVYRRSRAAAKEVIRGVKAAGYDVVLIEGDSDISEIVSRTCLEMGLRCVAKESAASTEQEYPCVVAAGLDLRVVWPDSSQQ